MNNSESSSNDVEAIGTVAGLIWHALEENGPMTLSKLVKQTGAPRDAVMQGVGWLAREGKVAFRQGSRTKQIELA